MPFKFSKFRQPPASNTVEDITKIDFQQRFFGLRIFVVKLKLGGFPGNQSVRLSTKNKAFFKNLYATPNAAYASRCFATQTSKFANVKKYLFVHSSCSVYKPLSKTEKSNKTISMVVNTVKLHQSKTLIFFSTCSNKLSFRMVNLFAPEFSFLTPVSLPRLNSSFTTYLQHLIFWYFLLLYIFGMLCFI